jgi:hypothetical protein
MARWEACLVSHDEVPQSSNSRCCIFGVRCRRSPRIGSTGGLEHVSCDHSLNLSLHKKQSLILPFYRSRHLGISYTTRSTAATPTPAKITATPINTPTSKKSRGSGSTSKQTRFSGLKSGMRLGGASNLFTKPHTPRTTDNKSYRSFEDDSAGSAPESDDLEPLPSFSASKKSRVSVSPSDNAARYAKRRSASGKSSGANAHRSLFDHSDPDSDEIQAAFPISKSRRADANKTPTRKKIADSDSTSDVIEVAHPYNAPPSPFEVAARAAESKFLP